LKQTVYLLGVAHIHHTSGGGWVLLQKLVNRTAINVTDMHAALMREKRFGDTPTYTRSTRRHQNDLPRLYLTNFPIHYPASAKTTGPKKAGTSSQRHRSRANDFYGETPEINSTMFGI
jgi:hypothetical protein